MREASFCRVGLDLCSVIACSCCLGVYLPAAAAITFESGIVGNVETIFVGIHVGGALDATVVQTSLV